MRFLPEGRPSPAIVVATAALVVALGGTGYAGTQFGKNSIGARQIEKGAVRSNEVANGTLKLADIKASARETLTGTDGTSGPAAPAGATGATGATGQQGPPGPLVDTLPSGATLRGAFASGATKIAPATGFSWDAISFPFPLASAPTPNIISVGGSSTTECPGSLADPTAAPGNLCAYLGVRQNVINGRPRLCDLEGNNCGTPDGADRNGAVVEVVGDADGVFYVSGTWAVTAP
jgi:hypothetical protein